jgi:hypothetical protein
LPRQLLDENTRVSYRIAVAICQGTPELGLWIYRIGAPYRISGDGNALRAIQPFADPGAHVYNGRVPAMFMLAAGTQMLEVELATIPYLNFGLVRLEMGPQQALAVSRAVDYNALTTFNDTSSAVIALVAVLSLGFGSDADRTNKSSGWGWPVWSGPVAAQAISSLLSRSTH